ncbi:MAG TPA: hypothetical protein VNM67_24905 [Thermoanaerobaculia bacterium]|jgi:hypothetical protein|nr:hypothetical protein [Thermoanaerobaculia bacterium]
MPSSARRALVLALAVLAVGLVQFYPTFRLAYAYDDLDCLNAAADVLAGKAGFWETAFRPHNEHVIPLFRGMFLTSAAWFGIDATPFRLAIFAAHLLTAWFLSLLALKYSGRPSAALATGLAYVIPCGLSSMTVWVIIAATVTVGLVGISGATLALACRQKLGVRRARLLAGAGCIFALLMEGGIMPLLLGPMLLDEMERRRAGEKRLVGPFSIFCLIAMAASTLATTLLYKALHGHRPTVDLIRGLPRALFLMAITPYRLFFPGLGLPTDVGKLDNVILWSCLGLAVAAPVAVLLLALWRRGTGAGGPLGLVTLVNAVGPLGMLFLVGAGRWNWSPFYLFEADRYFFTLLLPLSLLAGAVAATAAERMQGWTGRERAAVLALCLLAAGAELWLHRRALMHRVPFDVFDAHGRRFDQLAQLGQSLQAAAASLPPGSPPLSLPDGNLWFHDVHNGRISARLLLHVIVPESPRLRLSMGPVSARDAAVLNPVFEAWGREIDEPELAPVVADGELGTRAVKNVDFRTGARNQAVAGGFHGWEGSYRWMGRRGELRIQLICRGLTFHLGTAEPALKAGPLNVKVTAVDEVAGVSAVLGTISIAQAGAVPYPLDALPFLSQAGSGRRIRLVLESDRTWRPADLIPGSADPRELSVQVLAAGCE